MRKKSIIVFIFFIIFLLPFYHINTAFSDSIPNPYCVTPPFIQANLPSNIMLVLDYSGSMSWDAYSGSYDSNETYYGYFIPDENYECSEWNLFHTRCDGYWYRDPNGSHSGNYLNWKHMKRIDILRWILTGGKTPGGCIDIKSCETYSDKTSCEANPLCEWRGFWHWHWCSNKYYCPSLGSDECSSNELCSPGESVIITYDGTKIKKEDVSSYNPEVGDVEGILQKIRKLEQRPRIGAILYKTVSPYNPTTVFERVDLSYEYVDLINKINDTEPVGGTHTKEALEDIKSLFSRTNSHYSQDPYEFGGNTAWCAKNFAILMSDGEWRGGETQTSEYDPVKPADEMWKGGKADLVSSLKGNQNVRTYSVAIFLNPEDEGTNSLKWMAVYGNYNDLNNDGHPCNQSNYPNTSLTENENLENSDTCNEVKKNKDGTGPYGFFEGDNPEELKKAITEAFSEILKQVSSGTAASILAASEKSGANILQAIFYPKKYFENSTEADWIGKLQNLWFYLGPFMRNIREDSGNTNCSTGDKCFTLSEDKVIEFYFDNSTNETKVNICTDTNGNGRIDEDENATCEVKLLEDINPIWEAGKVLWKTSPTYREIFTWLDNTTYEKISFTPGNADEFKDYLDASNSTEASDIIKYIRGEDISGKRSRTVTMDSHTHVWKLGDIVYSTPKVISSVPLNTYHIDYHDDTYREFTSATDYKNRGMVFVGANDGMLHAFRLGKLSFPGGNVLAKLTKPDNGDFGSEAWAFIPKNALPYLKYYMDPSYCHLYYVDLTPYVFDASIGDPNDENLYGQPADEKTAKSWRTILIGGMNFGGACGGNATGAVHPPSLSSPATGVGKSSYFAMDVTNPENPQIMWEFTDNNTAFTTTGPAIIHIPYKDNNGEDDNSKNGYWYVVFASGPDNYDGTVHQPLYLYVLDLKTGTLKRKIQLSGTEGSVLGNINAFAGRFFESQADLGKNYSDDVLYFGYTYKGSSWDGGILRLVTGNDPDVEHWKVSKLIDGVGPVTSGVSYLEDTNNGELWVYFGEGRYFTSQDDMSAQRRIYGVKDPCYSGGGMNTSCTASPLSRNDLTDVTNNPNKSPSDIGKGWYINLESSSGGYGAERVITDPVATTDGWVFYTTFMPTSDICGFGGNTYMWMVNYNNGGVPQNVGGVIFVQASTGVIKKIELSKEFGKNNPGTYSGRRLATPIAGAPSPSSGITVIKPPESSSGSLIQWRETPVRKGE